MSAGGAVPRHVDHDERRRMVTMVAADLLAGHGRPALTVRNVAQAAGCSTTIVSHYFEDMADLLGQTNALAAERARARIDAVLAADPADIVGLIEAVLPLDDARRADWRVWLAFWSEALAVESFADEQRLRARTMVRRIERCLELRAQRDGLSGEADLSLAAHRLGALVQGIAAEALFDPRAWGPSRQRAVMRSELQLVGFSLDDV
ncbi:MAG: TetR family transcriptional regulator C-terminal domain-containing protein [Acidimicrobiales bacterium]